MLHPSSARFEPQTGPLLLGQTYIHHSTLITVSILCNRSSFSVIAVSESQRWIQFVFSGLQKQSHCKLLSEIVSVSHKCHCKFDMLQVDGGGISASDCQRMFDIVDCVNTGMNTYAMFTNISMMQNTDVYAHVIGLYSYWCDVSM